MEILNAILDLITSVGFPAAMTLLMFKYMTEQNTLHIQERKEMRETIDKNTDAINRLSSKF